MIRKEAWYREVQGFLAEQDSQGLDEDTWPRPKSPGRYPANEENHPHLNVKKSFDEKDTGGEETEITLPELMSEYPGVFESIFNYFRGDIYQLLDIINGGNVVNVGIANGGEVGSFRVTKELARQLWDYFRARGRVRVGLPPLK